jgi:hypothetical protein
MHDVLLTAGTKTDIKALAIGAKYSLINEASEFIRA